MNHESIVVHCDPDILGGTAVFVGTRVPVKALLDYIAGGHTLDDFLDDYPTVTRAQAVAVLEQGMQLLSTLMRVLLDECIPRKLRDELPGHNVKTIAEMKWTGTKNGDLLKLAEVGFDVLLTVDQGIPFQQNLAGTNLALVVIVAPSNDIKDLRPSMPEVLRVLISIQPGQTVRVSP